MRVYQSILASAARDSLMKEGSECAASIGAVVRRVGYSSGDSSRKVMRHNRTHAATAIAAAPAPASASNSTRSGARYVHPRSRNRMMRTGIGIPSSHKTTQPSLPPRFVCCSDIQHLPGQGSGFPYCLSQAAPPVSGRFLKPGSESYAGLRGSRRACTLRLSARNVRFRTAAGKPRIGDSPRPIGGDKPARFAANHRMVPCPWQWQTHSHCRSDAR